jgi:spore cortex formation protein SpoVR/YcgB (stage V sporulation)
MEEWQLRSMEDHARYEGWLGEAAVHRLIDSLRRLQEIEHSRYEENHRLRAFLERALASRIDEQWLQEVRAALSDARQKAEEER